MDQTLNIRPFAFDRIFAMPAAAAPTLRTEDLQLQIVSLEAELERMAVDHMTALTLARAEGFDAGLSQARGEQHAALLSATDALQSTLELTDERLEEIITRATQDAAGVALAAAEMLAGRAIAHDPNLAVDQAIGRVLEQVARGQDVWVRVNPSLVEDVKTLIGERQSRDRRRLNLHVVPDEQLISGDAQIEWDQGGLTLDAAERAIVVRAELESLLPPE